jgi:NAD(P)-dependent dehydrogenase (short-subunit alcohol dehydrogenase family)
MSRQFDGKVILVTGGSSGIGRAAAILFAEKGARIVVAANSDVQGGEETAEMIRSSGGEALFVKADVSSAKEVKAMVDKTFSVYKRLDGAFNNAGVFPGIHPLADYTEKMWDWTIDINLKGAWLCMKYEIPLIIESGGGAIVNTSSVAGLIGHSGHYGYAASKWGLNGITKCAAVEFARSGVRVNAICPGIIETPMSVNGDLLREDYKSIIPLGRFGKVADVAETTVWLCSDAAAYITGQLLAIDGGWTIP